MVKIIYSTFFLFISFGNFAQENLLKIRSEFYAASLDDQKVPVLLDQLNTIEQPHAIEIAYKAATEALMAKVVWNPFKKIRYVMKARDTFKIAMDLDPDNIECRFLRFAVEHHIPSYLGFSENLEDDKKKIFEILPDFDYRTLASEHLKYIFLFLIESERCNAEELELIAKVSAQFSSEN